MKRKLLLTKTLLIAFGLFMGSNVVWAETKTYDFYSYVNSNVSAGSATELTLTGENIATADGSNVKVISDVTGLAFDGRFAAEDTSVKLRNGNSKSNIHDVNLGIQYQGSSGSNHFSILNLNAGDVVTITTGYGTTSFASTNATVGGVDVVANARVGSDVNNTEIGAITECTMKSAGNLDLILGSYAVIMSVKIKTYSDSYQITSTSVVTDGTVVDDVRGITMAYHGNWTYQYKSDRGGDLVYGTYPTGSTNNLPDDGMYFVFTPSVTGKLEVNVNIYGGHGTYYLVDKDNGHIFSTKSDKKNNDYTNLKDFGTIIAGHTYYLYGLSCDWGYQFHSFKFTPKDNDITSYVVNTAEIVNVGSEIDYVPGISMTYGGAAESTWNNGSAYNNNYTSNSGGSASLTDDGIPSSGTYVIFNPTVNGRLTIGSIGYSQGNTCYTRITDGTNMLSIEHIKGEGNSYKSDMFSSVLEAGTTYYVYFAGGGYAGLFSGFTFTPTPATITASAIGTIGWSTFSSEYPLDLSGIENGTAYYASAVDDSKVTLTSTTAKVSAGEGLLLKGTEGAIPTIPIAAGFTTSAISGNKLVGCANGTTLDANANLYVLVKNGGTPEFQSLATNGATIPAGKAYLNAGINARSLQIVFDETTGVEAMHNAQCTMHNEMYDLQGRRVAQPKKGLYIKDGQKVYIK